MGALADSYGEIKATPRSTWLGRLADLVKSGNDFASEPFGYQNPPARMILEILGVPDVAKTLDRLSYGDSLTTGRGMTTRPRDEVMNAAMAVAPLIGPAANGINRGAAAAGKALEPAFARAVPAIMKRGGLPAEMLQGMAQGTQSPLTVWHGSPHKFDKFDASKIGTGEGVQAYGHGLYLAEAPEVAKGYQSKLSQMTNLVDGQVTRDLPSAIVGTQLKQFGGDVEKTRGYFLAKAAEYEKMGQSYKPALKQADEFRTFANQVDSFAGKSFENNTGNLYKVDLPDEHIAKMLDWDKPLSQQAPSVRAAVMATKKQLTPDDIENLGGAAAVRTLYDPANKIDNFLGTWESLRGKRDAGETLLRQQGIPGIRYLDGGSRGTGAGTSNFVVFPGNEDILQILERNGQPLIAP